MSKKLKVLANDGLHASGIAILEEAGIEVDLNKKKPDELVDCIGEYDAIIIRSKTSLKDEKIIEAGAPPNGRLKIIGRSGVGFDNVNVDLAALNGVVVKNAPFGNSTSTAEVALMHMLCAARNLAEAHHKLKSKEWIKGECMGIELDGKTLGVVGCGRIGQKLAQWVQGTMNVVGYDIDVEGTQMRFPNSKIQYVDFDELLAKADFISVHVGGKTEIIGAKEIAKMKKTAIIVNTSRGGAVNEDALHDAIVNKNIFGAGLDVHINEPKDGKEFSSPLVNLHNVPMSPHIGATTDEAQTKTSEEMARVIRDYLLGGGFRNAVNMENGGDEGSVKTEFHLIFVNHEDAPGVFSDVTSIPGKHGANIKNMPTKVFSFKEGDAKRAMTILRLEEEPSEEIVKEINDLENVHWALT